MIVPRLVEENSNTASRNASFPPSSTTPIVANFQMR